MNQLRHHRQRRSSAATSLDFSPHPNTAYYDSRKSGDNLSNILRTGILPNSGSTSMANPPPSVPQHSIYANNASATLAQVKSGSGFTSFMTPNTHTSRQYDAQMQSFGVQMGFGAVPSRVGGAGVTQKRKRSKSRSQSSRRPATI